MARACWSAGYISREMWVFIKVVKANAKISSCWAQKGCGTVPKSSVRLRSAWSYGQKLLAYRNLWTVSHFGIFLFLWLFWAGLHCGFESHAFFPASWRCAAFFLSFESRRQPDVEFFFPSCLQPVCCLYQLLDSLLDYLEQKKALLTKCNRLHKHLETIPSST